MSDHEQPEGYDGEVTVRAGSAAFSSRAVLGARFDPLVGSVVWSGRVDAALTPSAEVALTTPHGTGRARATEHDVWGHTRVTGIGRPPFPVQLLDGRPSTDGDPPLG